MQIYPARFNSPRAPVPRAPRAPATWSPARPPSFEDLYVEYGDAVRRLIHRLVGDEEEARDLAQDAFLKVHRALPRFRPHNARGWVLRIARNVALDALRRRRTVRWRSLDALHGGGRAGELAVYAALRRPVRSGHAAPAAGESPEERAVAADEIRSALSVARELGPRHAAVLALRAYGCLTYAEIGERLGLAVPAVKSLLCRTRLELRRRRQELPAGTGDALPRLA